MSFDVFRRVSSLFGALGITRPTNTYYLTGTVTGLTDADVANVAVSVIDEAENDYSEKCKLTVKRGRLALFRPAGMSVTVR